MIKVHKQTKIINLHNNLPPNIYREASSELQKITHHPYHVPYIKLNAQTSHD